MALEAGGRRFTYAALNERVNRLAHTLSGLGITRGERIAILAENRLEYLELELAAAKLGAIVACQNWRQSDAELAYCITLAEPELALVSERYAATLARLDLAVPRTLVLGRDYEAALARASAAELPEVAEPEDGLIILYTSGTTGLPKGALISHRAMVARSMVSLIDGGLFPERTFVAWAPCFHMVSTDHLLAAMMHGGKAIILDGFDPAGLVEIVAREAIGWLQLMPATVGRMIAELKSAGIRPKGVAVTGAMADLVPRHEIAEITTLLQAPFRNTFGSTETGSAPGSRGLIPVGVVPERLSKRQSSFCAIRLVDADDREVANGEPGEVAFRGPTLFSGYWRAPEANAEDFRGGWFHMGDLLRRNADGSLDFVDRRKYLIKSGGENIYPAEIERVLLASPRIADAVVVRRADPRWGEVPVAFVVRRDPALTADEVVALCRGQIAGYKLPKAVRFITDAELPRSTTGKVKRHDLEALLKEPPAADAT
ncbi:MAG: long-chain fatty acid--CoA ligase [Alphaproteobacteria bacterium]|nr:long-chain fatty acid--CoA ligase [Alphaproteobacteria bacterium]